MKRTFANPWTIDITSNETGYPKGSKVKILLNPDGSYQVKWRIADGREAQLTPLTLSDNGTLLYNDTANGYIEEQLQGRFDVDILVQTALQRLSGSSLLVPDVKTSPGQLVGQWGAESTGVGGEEGNPSQGKPAKPRPAKGTKPAKSSKSGK